MKTARIALILITLFVLSGIACAQPNTEAKDIFDKIICNAVCFLRYMVVAVAAIAMVVAGARYASTDDPHVRRDMKWQMIYSIFGLVIVVFGLPLANMITEELFSPFNCDCAALPDKITDFTQAFTCELICLVVVITASLCALTIIYAGIRYMTSGDDPATRRQMRNLAAYSLIGLFIVIFALPIVNFVAGDELEELDCDCMKFTSSKDRGDKLTITSVGTEEGTGGETVKMGPEPVEEQETEEAPNKPPVPEALVGFTRSEAKETASLRLDEGMRFFGSGSNDPDGSIVWYKWDFGDGETYEGVEGDTAHLYTEHGAYTAKLTVRDDDDLEVESEPVTVKVYEPPTAVARVGRSMDDLREGEITIDAAEFQMAEKIVFDGSESHSPNGDIVRYMWLEYESGERCIDFRLIGPEVQKEIRFPGEYTVHLEVMDSVGAKGYDSLLVDITSDPATTPIAEAYAGTSADDMTHKEISAHYGQEIYFNGLKSRSPDGRSIGCFWEFGDYSARGLSFLAAHTYEFHPQGGLEQEYTVTLYVAAESGPMVRDMVKVKLTRPLENEYIAIVKAGTDPENLVPAEELNVNELQRVYFDCSESDTGEERKCIWDEVDEALDRVRTIGTGDITSSKFKPGIHYVRLRAYDGVGDFGEALLTIDVEERPEEAEHGFTLLYVPFDWEGSLDGFDDLARESAEYIVDHLPLKDCPEKLEYFSAVENCILDLPKEGLKKSDDREFCKYEADVWAFLLKSCAEKTGHDYDYILGVTNQDVCGQSDGMSLMESDFLWFEAGSIGGALHELGHNWGLRDEYFDACRCWNLSAPNCLKRELDGDDSLWPGFEAYCAGGSECKSESQMAISLCKGNRNVYGGRCIMATEPYRPVGFCPVCMAHLKTIPQLNCGGVENG